MKNITFGFIGTGNMGGAIAVAASKSMDAKNIFLSDNNTSKAEILADKIGANLSSNKEIAEKCSYIFLGVKPQMMNKMLSEIAPFLKNRIDKFILVSMAAALSIEDIQSMAGNYPVIRIMPNTPAAVGEGVVLYCANDKVSDEYISIFKENLSKIGLLDKLDENLIDAASAVSGCGPAFVYMFIEALADGAVRCGLPRDKALTYAAHTLYGASKLLMESKKHPGELKDAVCSPGGTTIAGVQALEDGAFRASAMNAVVAAFDKTKQLGK